MPNPQPQPRLLVEERRQQILDLIDQQGRVTVEEMIKRFRVSAFTARADLDALSRSGSLIRSHGGAIRRGPQPDVPIAVKETLHHGEKVRIAQAAVQMIGDHDIVMLDSGTTTLEIARQIRSLRRKSLTIVTNALNIAVELASAPDLSIVLLGGILRPISHSFVGPPAEQTVKGFNVDRLFLGVDGFDLKAGLTTPDMLEAQLNAMMIQVSKEVVVVADSSKFSRRSLSVIAPLDRVHKVITDDGVPPDIVAALKERSIEVVIA